MRNKFQKLGFILRYFFLVCFTLSASKAKAQDNNIDARTIAYNNYNSIVKILLVDSLTEKENPGTGYIGRGSGFFVTDDGLIFTNRHVVKYALGMINLKDYDRENREYYTKTKVYKPTDLETKHYKINHISKASIIIQVFTNRNGSTSNLYAAKIVAIDTVHYDGAILKIVSDLKGNKVEEKFNPLKLANSDSTFQGEDLCLYGFPAQYDGAFDMMLKDQSTLTFGKHSGFDYVINSEYGFIKTDAAINSGNSGGPVFNKFGQVIGMATAASNKTNTGFIAGINGMYNIAQLDSSVGNRLAKLGLNNPPANTIPKTGIIKDPNNVLPSEKIIKNYNIDQSTLRRFKGGFWYLKASRSLLTKNTFLRISENVNDKDLKVNTTTNIKFYNWNQYDLGKVFTLWRINKTNKISLDWNIIDLAMYKVDFSNSNFISDSISTYTYNSIYQTGFIGTKLGLKYSKLIAKRITLDLSYKYGVAGDVNFDKTPIVQTLKYVRNDSLLFSQTKNLSFFNSGFTHNIGLDLRYKYFILALDIQLIKFNTTLYGILRPNQYWHSQKENLYAGFTDINFNQRIQTISLSLGVCLGGNKRWKRLN